MNIEELIERFTYFTDWEERYAYLIELGRRLPGLSECDKTEANRVHGCTSNVWLMHALNPDGKLHLNADSDAHIVRGLVAIMLIATQDKTPAEILTIDFPALFGKLELTGHLSPTRSNGLAAMARRIQSVAAEYMR